MRDMSNEGIAKFKQELDSQYQMIKDGIIKKPTKQLIEDSYRFYSQLDKDEKDKFKEIKKSLGRKPSTSDRPLANKQLSIYQVKKNIIAGVTSIYPIVQNRLEVLFLVSVLTL